mmetsp:Transcript_40102/g.159498  ORF Transcript_40102/g.159498 Transcript_40102/m.159498 type:complete len:138 (-) Transcript_40102:136-549(-)
MQERPGNCGVEYRYHRSAFGATEQQRASRGRNQQSLLIRVRHAGRLIAAQIAAEGPAQYQATIKEDTTGPGLHFQNDDGGGGSIFSKSLTVLPRSYRANETIGGLLRSLGEHCSSGVISIKAMYRLSSLQGKGAEKE